MKTFLKRLTALVLTLCFFSCSEKEIDSTDNILGVWETTVDPQATSSISYTLVFGKNHTGLFMVRNTDDSNITSTASSFNWLKNKKEILLDNSSMETSYILNDNNELVTTSSLEMRFVKVSNDFSKYY